MQRLKVCFQLRKAGVGGPEDRVRNRAASTHSIRVSKVWVLRGISSVLLVYNYIICIYNSHHFVTGCRYRHPNKNLQKTTHLLTFEPNVAERYKFFMQAKISHHFVSGRCPIGGIWVIIWKWKSYNYWTKSMPQKLLKSSRSNTCDIFMT